MHVIITMAGHSRRFLAAGFQGPKALLQCGEKRMIEHAIDMFDTNNDHFHIILNENQNIDNPNLVTWLKTLASRVSPVIIPSHEIGPVYSVMQIEGIPEDAEVLIAYCDFYVDWSYQRFRRQVHGLDGAVVSFRGFQPASFGSTYYAYMRVNGNLMEELREKKTFTDDRTSEHASAGIYYFREWSLFKGYANRLLQQKTCHLQEAYVSLLYNDMVSDDLTVGVYEVSRFICLGTPEDYEQYLFWWQFFIGRQEKVNDTGRGKSRVALMPMAGRGSRFVKFGYRVAKPLILVNGVPMAIRAAVSLPPVDDWIFLPRADDLSRHPIEGALRDLPGGVKLIGVHNETSGQAATCLLAEDLIPNNAELIITSCDYEVRYSAQAWLNLINDNSIDGVIWTFRCRGMPVKDPNAFAYCLLNDDGRTVKKLVEKKAVSQTPHLDPLVVGTFWFRRAADFKKAAHNLINKDILVNGEHYVGTSINYLVENGYKFVIFDVEQWISFGDPFELQIMEFWQDHFTDYSVSTH